MHSQKLFDKHHQVVLKLAVELLDYVPECLLSCGEVAYSFNG
jgi:hypothetical protein